MNQWPEYIRHIQMEEGEGRGQKGAGFLPWQELGVTQECTRDWSWSQDQSRDHFLMVSISSRTLRHFHSDSSRSQTGRTRDL